jgi:hypothetical protein
VVIDAETVEVAQAAESVDGVTAGDQSAVAKPTRRRSAGGARKAAGPKKPRATSAKPRGKKKE